MNGLSKSIHSMLVSKAILMTVAGTDIGEIILPSDVTFGSLRLALKIEGVWIHFMLEYDIDGNLGHTLEQRLEEIKERSI